MTAYYNEHDPFAAAWLRELIAVGAIAPGDVDGRSIEDVTPDDLRPYRQCHFFAGIGVWSYALRSAGWDDDRPIWTGSCPCQPFSAAGKGAGFADERHLWPAWFHLITQCEPDVVAGEQVADRGGAAWLDLVQADMEAADFAFGAVVAPAAGFGAPHLRHRSYWVAYSQHAERRTFSLDREDGRNRKNLGRQKAYRFFGTRREVCRPGPTDQFWRDADWLYCRDERWRPVEPGTFPLAHGATNRVGALRGYGNAIVAAQATAFVEAFKGWIDDRE